MCFNRESKIGKKKKCFNPARLAKKAAEKEARKNGRYNAPFQASKPQIKVKKAA